MRLAVETNTGIDYYEKCSFGELMGHIKTFNRIFEERQKRQERQKRS